MNNFIKKKLKEFDEFINSLPSRVSSTPRNVVKDFVKKALQEAYSAGEKKNEEKIKEYQKEMGRFEEMLKETYSFGRREASKQISGGGNGRRILTQFVARLKENKEK